MAMTNEKWKLLIKYYDEGHTMEECGKIWGVNAAVISRYFKKIGKKARQALVPSREEKYARTFDKRLVELAKKQNASDPAPVEQCTPPPAGEPPKRRIISLKGNGGEGKMLYEKEIS